MFVPPPPGTARARRRRAACAGLGVLLCLGCRAAGPEGSYAPRGFAALDAAEAGEPDDGPPVRLAAAWAAGDAAPDPPPLPAGGPEPRRAGSALEF